MPTRVLDPTDALAHVIGHVLWNPRRDSFSWIVDAALLARRHPEIEWARLTNVLIRSNLALPALLMLSDLKSRFGVAVSADALEMLNEHARHADRLERLCALEPLRQRPPRRLHQLLRVSGWRSRAVMLWVLLAPPAAYMREVEGATGTLGMMCCYLRRPRRFVARQYRKASWRLRRALGLIPSPSTSASVRVKDLKRA